MAIKTYKYAPDADEVTVDDKSTGIGGPVEARALDGRLIANRKRKSVIIDTDLGRLRIRRGEQVIVDPNGPAGKRLRREDIPADETVEEESPAPEASGTGEPPAGDDDAPAPATPDEPTPKRLPGEWTGPKGVSWYKVVGLDGETFNVQGEDALRVALAEIARDSQDQE